MRKARRIRTSTKVLLSSSTESARHGHTQTRRSLQDLRYSSVAVCPQKQPWPAPIAWPIASLLDRVSEYLRPLLELQIKIKIWTVVVYFLCTLIKVKPENSGIKVCINYLKGKTIKPQGSSIQQPDNSQTKSKRIKSGVKAQNQRIYNHGQLKYAFPSSAPGVRNDNVSHAETADSHAHPESNPPSQQMSPVPVGALG